MTEPGTFDWLFLLTLMFGLGWLYFVQAHHFVLRHRSRRWPTSAATIQKGAIGRIHSSKCATAPASFMGYAFVVESIRYAGSFALCGEEPLLRKLNESLTGQTIQVRYDPSDPNISFLADCYDPRFGGVVATQNPEWLDDAPPSNIHDAIR